MRPLVCFCAIFLPLAKLAITSPFGYRRHPVTGQYAFHNGVDLRGRSDTVFAVLDGQISSVSYNEFLGIAVCLAHGDTLVVYGHLSRVIVSPGWQVNAGDPIAITGNTGRVTGEHLHLSIRIHNSYVDPLEFIYQTLINNRNHE